MSPASPSSRPSRARSAAIRATYATVLLTMTALAVADPPPAPSPAESRVTKIALADLDLASPQGVRVARQRVTAAAQRLCWQLGDPNRASNRATVSACVRATIAETMEAIQPPQVAALSGKQ
jgi:UrcA family protein